MSDSDRPLRIVLASVGSRGDVQPMLALAQTLRARGHTVLIAAPPNFAAWTHDLGFEFAPLSEDIQAFLAENRDIMTGRPLKMLRVIHSYFKAQIPLQAQQLVPICRGADAIVWGGLALCAPSVAEHLGLPELCVLYSNCVLPSDQHPPPNIPWHGLPRWVNTLFWNINHLMVDLLLRRSVNSMRASLGLPPKPHLRDHLLEAGSVVIAADEELFPPDPQWQGRYPYVNSIFFDDPTPLDPELDAWLAAGEPPVYIGFGSMSGKGTDRIERILVEALAASGRRCLLDAGWAGLGAGALPPGWRSVRGAPHAALFARVAVVVHHGGSGTTAQALRAGVPQVLLPLILDQFHHAHRLHLAGIAPAALPMEKVSAAALAQAIDTAIHLPDGPRQAAALRLRASDARTQIALRLESLVAARVVHCLFK
ncbi:MAG: glycosyltransferase [Burkholderiales bacterium]|nr:glycosyltransferase [Burkholderiales bacterium]